MRMSVKGQSVLQKRAAAEVILRLEGAWGRKPSNKQKHLLGPRCPACGFLCFHINGICGNDKRDKNTVSLLKAYTNNCFIMET